MALSHKSRIDKVAEAKSAGKERKQARDEKRAESRRTWSARWDKVKEFGQKVWDNVKQVGEWPGQIVDSADQLRTDVEVGYQQFRADLSEQAFNITNQAAEAVDQAVGFVESLPERARAKVAELKLMAMKEAALAAKSLIDSINSAIEQGQETPGEAVVTAADRAKASAEDHRKKSEAARSNAQGLGRLRGWLRDFSK
ncbi:MAG: hypothetical protein IT416_04355 [Candidatus Pacebacteria bacterium]|nr:hypothetical protein [Candidatus Paceibacterota bacterium]